jgi:hypothetical protein
VSANFLRSEMYGGGDRVMLLMAAAVVIGALEPVVVRW